MRKWLLILIPIFLLVLIGCSSTVGVSYMNPSNVDMGKYRNIAIASTVEYKGRISYPMRIRATGPYTSRIDISPSYTRAIVGDVADYATNSIVSILANTGYYSILSPEKTDKYMDLSSIGYSTSEELLKSGYDAVMIPRIEEMDIDEYVWSSIDGYRTDSRGFKYPIYEFEVRRVASLKLSISVVDCRTDKIIARKTYSDTLSWSDDFDPDIPRFSRDAYYMFKYIINSFKYDILDDFVPSLVVEDIKLMSNKPKLDSAKSAYDAVKDGNYKYAYELFYKLWQEDGHIPSGCNAALLDSSFGNYDSALDLLNGIMKVSNNKDVSNLYNRISKMKAKTIEAEAQIDGSATSDSSSSGMSVYQYLMEN